MSKLLVIWTALAALASWCSAEDFYEAAKVKESAPWGPMAVALLAAVAVAVVAFKKSGRTHLD